MSQSSFETRVAAAMETAGPKVTGQLVSEDTNSIVLKAADAIIEVATGDITERSGSGRGNEVELTLTATARLIVSTVVTVDKGFVGSNVFGPLVPDIVGDNCNCNCNCSSIQDTAASVEASRLRRPFTGGARISPKA